VSPLVSARMNMKPSLRPLDRRGVTLVEIMVVTLLLVIVIAGIAGILVHQQREFVGHRATRRAEGSLHAALGVASSVLRTAGANPYGITFTALEPNPMAQPSWSNVVARSDFAPADGDVADVGEDVRLWTANDTMFARWTAGGATEAVAAPVRGLSFTYFRPDGTEITSAADVPLAVRVRVTATAPADAQTTRLIRRSAWVYLRN
jgi:type II secretory pathway pseudopilin PulG